MRVLVTGAAGFLGRAVTRRFLLAGHEVTALLHRPASVGHHESVASTANADVRDVRRVEEIVREGRFDGICHLAALARGRESIERPVPYYAVNVSGTINLLAALGDRRNVRFILASSMAVYGEVADEDAIDEDRIPRPTNPYGASKLAAEQLVGYQAATGAIAAISLRCFNVAGAIDSIADPDTSRVIPKAIAVAAGQAPHFGLNGDGSAVREFAHVADVADAFLLALDAAEPGRHEVLNIGSGVGVSMREVLRTVERVSGHRVALQMRPPQPEPQRVVAKIDRARSRLGWAPTSRSTLSTIVQDAWAARCAEADRTGSTPDERLRYGMER